MRVSRFCLRNAGRLRLQRVGGVVVGGRGRAPCRLHVGGFTRQRFCHPASLSRRSLALPHGEYWQGHLAHGTGTESNWQVTYLTGTATEIPGEGTGS